MTRKQKGPHFTVQALGSIRAFLSYALVAGLREAGVIVPVALGGDDDHWPILRQINTGGKHAWTGCSSTTRTTFHIQNNPVGSVAFPADRSETKLSLIGQISPANHHRDHHEEGPRHLQRAPAALGG